MKTAKILVLSNVSAAVAVSLRRLLTDREQIVTITPESSVELNFIQLSADYQSVLEPFKHLIKAEFKADQPEPEPEPEAPVVIEQNTENTSEKAVVNQTSVQEQPVSPLTADKAENGDKTNDSEAELQARAKALADSTNKDSLIAAAKTANLPHDGDKITIATRLIAAGITAV